VSIDAKREALHGVARRPRVGRAREHLSGHQLRATKVPWKPRAFVEAPTAVQPGAEVHATAVRTLSRAAVGLGVGWIVHVLPFQLSANVTSAPVAPEAPTAVQLVGAVQVTPERLLFCAPAGAGVV
jgi:hypothetical protein